MKTANFYQPSPFKSTKLVCLWEESGEFSLTLRRSKTLNDRLASEQVFAKKAK